MLFQSFDFIIFFTVLLSQYFCSPWLIRLVFGFVGVAYPLLNYSLTGDTFATSIFIACVIIATNFTRKYYSEIRAKKILLLGASLVFYASIWLDLLFVAILLFIALITFLSGILIKHSQDGTRRTVYFICGLCFSVSFLVFFKYINFIFENISLISSYFSHHLISQPIFLIVPLGISFYTFKALSYIIDVYRGDIEPSESLVDVVLYVSFFPTLLMGPIDRAGSFLQRMSEEISFDPQRVKSGLLLMIAGMMKKLLIADPLKPIVDQAFANPELYSGLSLVIASYCYAFQLYCDFAGYSDIAIGAAKILGFDVVQNFRLPYFATTVRDFWRRWHISLSNWLRDYIYISLGGNRKGIVLSYVNIMITMILCGLWHGASWPFVFWGTMHGVLLCCSRVTLPFRDRVYKSLGFTQTVVNIIRALITFHLISVLWIFFRAETIKKALEIIGRIILGEDGLMVPYLLPLILIPFFLLTEAVSSKREVIEHLLKYPRLSRIIIYASIILLIAAITAVPQTGFLYFAF